jgi:transposase
MSERYGPYQTAYDRFCRWRDDGTWARLKAAVIALAEVTSHKEDVRGSG